MADMSDQGPGAEERPVVWGLVALLAVGLTIGVLVSGAALATTSVLGLRGGDGAAVSGSEETVFIPKPSITEEPDGPLITLAPRPSNQAGSQADEPDEEEEPEGISLSAARTSVAPGDKIDLTGVYPEGEGAVLKVQRLEDGEWVDFVDITATVSNETFSTFVITSRTGPNTWRMLDVETGDVSNEVKVQVG
jgi:hypothetical protein